MKRKIKRTIIGADGNALGMTLLGDGPGRVLTLHGWPGDRTDWDLVAAASASWATVASPDLRGFGSSASTGDNVATYTPERHVADVVAVLDALEWPDAIVLAHDVGAVIGQRLAAVYPHRVAHLLLADPPYGGIGKRRYDPDVVPEFWYQGFHQLDLSVALIDGKPDEVRAYLAHFYRHWCGRRERLSKARFEHLVRTYARPGAFAASIRYYRARAGVRATEARATPVPLATPTTIIWGELDPVMRIDWADQLELWFANHTFVRLPGVGHFVPWEAPDEVIAALEHTRR